MSEELMITCLSIKLSTGETLLTGPAYEKDGIFFVLYPLKINFTPILYNDKIVTQMVPVLYQPFGDNKYIPIVADHIISTVNGSELDFRFYKNSLRELLLEDFKRKITFDSFLNSKDYENIMETPETVQ